MVLDSMLLRDGGCLSQSVLLRFAQAIEGGAIDGQDLVLREERDVGGNGRLARQVEALTETCLRGVSGAVDR